MESWKIVETKHGAVVKPKREFKCPFCGHKLLLHQFHVNFQPVKKFYHVDIHLKCPVDGFFVTFGVAISKEEYEKLSKSKMNGVDLTDELLEVEELSEEDEEIIRKRLEQIGYWGG